ncbi:hypothetical protein ACKWTF_015790 [Chironomus riparius]
MNKLNHYEWIIILSHLNDDSLLNAIRSSRHLAQIAEASSKLMLKCHLEINPETEALIKEGSELSYIKFRRISITNFRKRLNELRLFTSLIKNFKNSIEILTLIEFKERSQKPVLDFFNSLPNLRILVLNLCSIQEEIDRQTLKPFKNLKEISFEKCDENYFEIFKNQDSVEKIVIINEDWTWNGFNHEQFNELALTLKNFKILVLKGIGTASYFDCDIFPKNIVILDTFAITFHWYVGIRTARINFLQSLKGVLKELTIHQLPNDFDGGRVLKYIIEEMKLEKFNYGDILLIKDGAKQDVQEFSSNEIQICSMIEMFFQFPSIKKFTLILNQTDIDSSEIERFVNPPTYLFMNVEVLEIVDKSEFRRIFGVFLGLFKNFRAIKILKIKSPDRNINALLQEFLPRMSNINEFYIDSIAPRVEDRFETIRICAPVLKKLSVDFSFVEQARTFFGANVEVFSIENVYN